MRLNFTTSIGAFATSSAASLSSEMMVKIDISGKLIALSLKDIIPTQNVSRL